jgi:hypothetical protein
MYSSGVQDILLGLPRSKRPYSTTESLGGIRQEIKIRTPPPFRPTSLAPQRATFKWPIRTQFCWLSTGYFSDAVMLDSAIMQLRTARCPARLDDAKLDVKVDRPHCLLPLHITPSSSARLWQCLPYSPLPRRQIHQSRCLQ